MIDVFFKRTTLQHFSRIWCHKNLTDSYFFCHLFGFTYNFWYVFLHPQFVHQVLCQFCYLWAIFRLMNEYDFLLRASEYILYFVTFWSGILRIKVSKRIGPLRIKSITMSCVSSKSIANLASSKF